MSLGWAAAIVLGFYGGIAALAVLAYLNHLHTNGIQPKAVMKGLEIAIQGYKTEYLTLPHVGQDIPTQDNEPFDTTDANGKALLDILLAKDVSRNPREIHFWEPPSAKSDGAGYSSETGLRDSWGKQGYKMILDYNGDGKITNPYASGNDGEPDEINADVIIYSAGATGIFELAGSKDGKGADDVKSWQ
jgi:hypothetical protein